MADVPSDPSTTQSVTATSDDWWIKDPDVPDDNLLITVVGEHIVSSEQDQAEFHPLADGTETVVYPVVVKEASARADRFTLEVDFLTDAGFNQLEKLRAKNKTLLMQSPTGEQWYFVFGPSWSVRLVNLASRWRFVTFEVVEVVAP